MSVKFYKLDAFTTQAFTGNPAAVVVLQSQQQFEDDILLQKVGTEFNLPATAMLLPVQHTGNDSLAKYKIKWFDPIKPIPICGHGTLAASHVAFNELCSDGKVKLIEYDAGPAGTLTAQRDAEGSIILDFPACKLVGMKEAGQDIKPTVDLQQVLQSVFPNDVEIKFVGRGDRGGYVDLVVVEVAENYPLKDAKLNGEVLAALLPEVRGLIFTTRSSNDPSSHIHSRVIHTETKLGEDQVTGSAHCMLAPYWIEKLQLGDTELKATQVSQRGGKMGLVWRKEDMRVLIRSSAVTLATGMMNLGV